MSILPIEKFIILAKEVALRTKIFMGKKANLVKFIWFVKYFFNVFAVDFNLRKNIFYIDMPPSFLLWRIMLHKSEQMIQNCTYSPQGKHSYHFDVCHLQLTPTQIYDHITFTINIYIGRQRKKNIRTLM